MPTQNDNLPFPEELILKIISQNKFLSKITIKDIENFTIKDQMDFSFNRVLTNEEKNMDPKYIECENFLYRIMKKKDFLEKRKKDKKFNDMAKKYENKMYNTFDRSNKDIVKKEIINHLILKKTDDATELVVEYIKTQLKFKSIISDNNPEMYYYNDGIYIPNAQSKIDEIARELFGIAYTGHLKNKVIDKIRADTYISVEDFFSNKHPNIVPLENGLFNLKTKELMEYDPEYIFTSKLPVTYKKDAKCKSVIDFFKDVLEHESDIKTMQELFGYTLWKKYSFQHAFMFLGNGRNGKGVTISLMKAMLGEKNVKGLSLQQIETKDFMIYSLIGKYANLCGDLSKKSLENTGQFKNLTGEDTITADRKYKESIDFVNFAKLIFACNDLPYSYDDSDGFYDRWIFFDFPYKFVDNIDKLDSEEEEVEKQYIKQKDPDLKNKLLTDENISGIFNWALEGLHRVWNNNKFTVNITTDDNRKRWKRQASSFNAFFEDCCEIDFNEHTSIDQLKSKYQDYCVKHKLKFEGNKIIKAVLESNGCDKEKKYVHEGQNTLETKQVWCWIGLKLQSRKSKQSKISVNPRNFKIGLKGKNNGYLDCLDYSVENNIPSVPKDYTEIGENVLKMSDKLIDDLDNLPNLEDLDDDM